MKKHNFLKGLVSLLALVLILGTVGSVKASADDAVTSTNHAALTYSWTCTKKVTFRGVTYSISDPITITIAKDTATATITNTKLLSYFADEDGNKLSKYVKVVAADAEKTAITFTTAAGTGANNDITFEEGSDSAFSSVDFTSEDNKLLAINPVITFKVSGATDYTAEYTTSAGVLKATSVMAIAQKLANTDGETYLSQEGKASYVIVKIEDADGNILYSTDSDDSSIVTPSDYSKDKIFYGMDDTTNDNDDDIQTAIKVDKTFTVTMIDAFTSTGAVYDPNKDAVKITLAETKASEQNTNHVKTIYVANVGTSSAKTVKATAYKSFAQDTTSGTFSIPLSDKTNGFSIGTGKDAYLYFTCYSAADGSVTANATAGAADVKKATIVLNYSKANQSDSTCDVISSITVAGTSGSTSTYKTSDEDLTDFNAALAQIQFSTDNSTWASAKDGTIVTGFYCFDGSQSAVTETALATAAKTGASTKAKVSGKAVDLTSCTATYDATSKTWVIGDITPATADVSALKVSTASGVTPDDETKVYIYNSPAKTVKLTGAQLYSWAYPTGSTKTTLYYRYIGKAASGEDASTRTIKSAKLTVAVAAKAPKVAIDAYGISKSIKNGYDFAVVKDAATYTDSDAAQQTVNSLDTAKSYLAYMDSATWYTILPFNKSGSAENEVVLTTSFVPCKYSSDTAANFTATKYSSYDVATFSKSASYSKCYVFVRKSASEKKPASYYLAFTVNAQAAAPTLTSTQTAAATLKFPGLTKATGDTNKTYEYLIVKSDDIENVYFNTAKWTAVAKDDVIDCSKLKYSYSTISEEGTITKVSGTFDADTCVFLVRTAGTAVKSVDSKTAVSLPSRTLTLGINVGTSTVNDAEVTVYNFVTK